MERRSVLKVLAVMPVIGLTQPAFASAPKLEDTSEGWKDWKGMAERLWANFVEYANGQARFGTSRQDWWTPDDMKIMEPVCYRFCHALLEPVGETNVDHVMDSAFTAHEFAASLYPSQPRDLVKKNVTFGVLDAPEATFEGVTKQSMKRKLRMSGLDRLREVMDDMRAFHGIDAEVEMISMLGHEAALDVLHEIRSDWELGGKVRTYGIYLPPHVGPRDRKMDKEFSICRRWMLQYAKFV